MPLTNDIVKCRLRRIDVNDYKVAFTQAEIAQLHRIFPDGVCEYSRRGVLQRDLLGTWLVYTGVGEYTRDKHGRDD